ncbi:MAG TPA: hypothetical protein ENF34_02165 [Candidatus Bathyarchaeota archaeon]|nr:hypothetical protein [Candidatus Bathyarchaeota archaeon]
MRRVLMVLVFLPILLALVSALTPPAGALAVYGRTAYPLTRPLKVAILSSEAWPDYVAGILHNEYELAYELLASDSMLDVMVITSDDIWWGSLDSFDIDVLLLIDNVPETYANDAIKSWWEEGGAIVALDSSIEFLCYAGILPAASEGSNGVGTYWDYDTSNTVAPVELVHPILRGYHEDLYFVYTDFAGYYESAMDDEPEWPYITVVARDKADSDLMAITAYDPPDKGRVAHLWFSIWDGALFYEPFLPNLLRNAVKWAGKLVMTMSIDVSNPAPLQGDVVELYAYVRDERGYLLTGAKVWAVAGEESINLRSSITPPFRFVGSLDTSRLLGEVEVHFYAYFEGLGTLHAWTTINVTGRFIVDARLDDATPTEGDTIRAYIQVEDYGHRPVEDATVTVMIGTSTISATHVADGLYVADIDTEGLSGPVSATVRVEKDGFEAKEVPLAFEVEEAPAPPAPPTPSLVPMKYVDLIALAGVGLGLIGLMAGAAALTKK